MYIDIDAAFKFIFTPDFSSLDGVYKVVQSLTYDEILASEIDMAIDLYARVNKTAEDWEADAESYRKDIFYKLEVMNGELEEDSFHIPISIVRDYPDPNIHEYGKLSIMVDLGPHADEDKMNSLIIDFQTILETNYGIASTPRLVVYDRTWMSETDYEVIDAAREAAKGTIINYKSESVRLEQELVAARAKIDALEQIIISP